MSGGERAFSILAMHNAGNWFKVIWHVNGASISSDRQTA
jgi:hypothetical protein